MKPTKMIAAFALHAASLTVFAQSREYVDPAADFVSTRSRAEVVDELRQARAGGERVGSEIYPGEQENLVARNRRGDRDQQQADRSARPELIVSGR